VTAARRVVWKFTIRPQMEFTLLLPAGWTFRHVGIQRLSARPIMWVEVDPFAPMAEYRFRMLLTGEEYDPQHLRFLGTVLMYNGDFVAHLHQVIQ
jgi:hypothetical protein